VKTLKVKPTMTEILAAQEAHAAVVAIMNVLSVTIGKKSAHVAVMLAMGMAAEACFPGQMEDFIDCARSARDFRDQQRGAKLS
tara:strand:- start:803 stop:1051 length:249 start_codon:yes stop_codon:yes gene_type:complete